MAMAEQTGGAFNWRARETISVGQYAELMGLCIDSAYSAIARGDVQAIRIGRRWLILVPPLIRAIDGQAHQPTANGHHSGGEQLRLI
jgi:hypothetical protein